MARTKFSISVSSDLFLEFKETTKQKGLRLLFSVRCSLAYKLRGSALFPANKEDTCLSADEAPSEKISTSMERMHRMEYASRYVNTMNAYEIKVLLPIFRSTLATYRRTFRPLPITQESRVLARAKVPRL